MAFSTLNSMTTLTKKTKFGKTLNINSWNDITSRVTTNPNILLSTKGFGYNTGYFQSSCISNNGKYMYLCSTTTGSNVLWFSNNSGNTFSVLSTSSIPNLLLGISCSNDGSIVCIFTSTYIYLSYDYGVTFTNMTNSLGPKSWVAVSMSNDSKYICGFVSNGPIYLSTDYGVSFNIVGSSLGNKAWANSSMSSDGKYICAIVPNATIYFSSDFGNTWTDIGSTIGGKRWAGISISSDGKYILATLLATYPDPVLYINNNYGAINSWSTTLNTQNPSNFYYCSMSSSGKSQVICSYYNGYVYYSNNYGASNSWTKVTVIGTNYLNGISISPDGNYILTYTQGNNPNKVYLC